MLNSVLPNENDDKKDRPTQLRQAVFLMRCGDLLNACAPIAYPHHGLAPRVLSHAASVSSIENLMAHVC